MDNAGKFESLPPWDSRLISESETADAYQMDKQHSLVFASALSVEALSVAPHTPKHLLVV